MAKITVKNVRTSINRLAAQAGKRMRQLKKQKNARALRALGSTLYEIRDTVEDAIGVFEEMSSDAEMLADDIEDQQQDRDDE